MRKLEQRETVLAARDHKYAKKQHHHDHEIAENRLCASRRRQPPNRQPCEQRVQRKYAQKTAQLDHKFPFIQKYRRRSEEHTSELQSLMRTSYAVCRLKTERGDGEGARKSRR